MFDVRVSCVDGWIVWIEMGVLVVVEDYRVKVFLLVFVDLYSYFF